MSTIFFKVIFILTKRNKMLFFLVDYYTTKTDIVRYYLLYNCIELKFCDQK